MYLVLAIFLLTYLAIAIGYLPGFKVDRTGAALLGAIALIVVGAITPDAAWRAADFGTLSVLFGLMIVSGAFHLAGFYHWVASWAANLQVRPPALLAVLIAVSAGLSSLLTNDVVVVAMTPLLIRIAMGRGLNPVPFLLGFCMAANAGSAGSLMGSPQNIIIAGAMHTSLAQFVVAAGVPALLAAGIIWATVTLIYRGRWRLAPAQSAPPAPSDAGGRPFNRREAIKAMAVLICVVAAFLFGPWPYAVVALTAAGVLLLNRPVAGVTSAQLLQEVDGDLLLIVLALYIVNAAFSHTAFPVMTLHWLAAHGFDLRNPYTMMGVMAALSDLADNNSAVMLLTPYADKSQPLLTTAALSLGANFSSNIVTFGSLAGIIVVEEASKRGVKISFGEFLRVGAISSLISIAAAAAWIWMLGRLT
jgi:Na+/H+ antiporter NhaD/arsenite permease-like protein